MRKSIPVDDFSNHEPERLFRFMSLGTEGAYSAREPHRHNYFEIFHFIKGGGEHMLDFESLEIKDGSLHFVAPGQVHMLRRLPSTTGYVLLFSEAFLNFNQAGFNLLLDYPAFNKSASPSLKTSASLSRKLEKLADAIDVEYRDEEPLKQLILGSYLRIYLLTCKPHFQPADRYSRADGNSQILIRKFHRLIENNFQVMHQVKSYAEKLNVTPNYLNDVAKNMTGKTALELIQDRLILEAKRYLLHSELNSKQIAFELNFNDPSYFSRFFRVQTNFSPNSYRNFVREKYHD